MNLQTQISQQQASVRTLEKLLRAKRCTQAELDQAKRRLTDLQQQENFTPIVERTVQAKPTPLATPVVTGGPQLGSDEYTRIQADLSKEADVLNRKMAELSNKLHLIPQSANCPELIKPILDYKAQIEAIWDKKFYLERNRCLPVEDAVDEVEPDLPTLEGADKFELAYRKRRLIDQRSKLRRKLGDPKAKAAKRLEWEVELTKVEMAIQEIELKLI